MEGLFDLFTKALGPAGSLSSVLKGVGTYAAGQQGINDLKGYGRELRTGAENAADAIQAGSTFKPFTVTTGLSTATTDANGGYNLALDPMQQFYQDELFGTAAGLLQGATQDQGTREQQIFNRLQAMMNPGQERERLALEERLQGQGRLGVSTAMYGGTPEQLALAKAQEEARTGAGFTAMQQAMAQQAQEANIGSGFFNMAYLPTQQAMASLAPATNLADIAGAGQRQGIQAATNLRLGGLESDVNARTAASATEQQMFTEILKLIGNQTNSVTGAAQGNNNGAGVVENILRGLFGGNK